MGRHVRYVRVEGQYQAQTIKPPDFTPITALRMQILAARNSGYGTNQRRLDGWDVPTSYQEIELDVVTHERRPQRVEVTVTWRALPTVTLMFPLEEVLVCLDYLEEHP
jgi:hypothetical protein